MKKLKATFVLFLLVSVSMLYSCKPNAGKKAVVENTNEYYIGLNKEIENFNSLTPELATGYAEYTTLVTNINQKHKEQTISDNEKEELVSLLSTKYIAWLTALGNKTLKNTQWNESDINSLMKQTEQLLNEEGTTTQNSPNYKDIKTIYKTSTNYFTAKKLNETSFFSSVSNVRSIIAEVKALQADTNLRYCRNLMEELSTIPQQLQNGHRQAIMNQIQKMDSMDKSDVAAYKNYAKKVENTISEYNQIANDLYGNNRYYDEMMREYKQLVQKYQYLNI